VTEAPALRLEPPAFLSDPALAAVLDALPRARLVGGCVRDTLAGRAVADVDLATPDGPEQVVAALRDAGLKSAPTGLKHGTVTAISHHRGFEITTLRRDVVTDGRHAEVAWTDDWQVDAARRDFTINAMFMARDGAVFDYFGGVGDLRAGRVRFVGDPASRIAEDYLRVLRFFRFQARYGGQPPDRATLDALRAGVPGLAKLSPERVWSELKRILLAPNPAASIRLMAELGVLAAVLPEATDVDALEHLVAAEAPADPMLRLAALAPCAGEALADRLRLSTTERSALQDLAGAPPDPALDGADLRRALADTPADILIARSWLAHGAAGAALRARLAATPRPRFTLAGRDALALGVPPGPEVGELIREVREWWLEGGCVATAAECRAELARRISGARLPAPSPSG
jgi:poly(A) polymerase/tRNA nucleotidyltransferase (CCA-adding enzyme)